ncbi:MAG TPA: hypothetical protein VJP02_12855, partial [Candidatus Sulfotelmatobacter sp.]|nr:hypothetical protein [Candidatus Sulfotelmatobacter sp.]
VFPKTRTLISVVCRMNRDNIRTPARSISNLEFHHTTDETNEVARRIVAALEEIGIAAINGGAVGFPMEADRWGSKMWVISRGVAKTEGVDDNRTSWHQNHARVSLVAVRHHS